MKKYRATVLCGSTKGAIHTKGNITKCSSCQEELWLSDSSLAAVKKQIPDIKDTEIETLCLRCGFKGDSKKTKLMEPSSEQIEEIVNLFKNTKTLPNNREL